jgi:hypothetical protein
MFRDDRQISRAVQILLKGVRLERLWTNDGPTPEAIPLLGTRGGGMSHGEAVMLLVCFDLWNGEAKVPFNEIIGTLDGGHLERLGSLLVALGSPRSSDIDGWIAKWSSRPQIKVKVEQQADGRFRAHLPDHPGLDTYGATEARALAVFEEVSMPLLANRCPNCGHVQRPGVTAHFLPCSRAGSGR